jgi:hypothetical protein
MTGRPVSPTGYHVVGQFPIGAKGGWDYILVDKGARRLYVSHGMRLDRRSCKASAAEDENWLILRGRGAEELGNKHRFL